MISQAVALKCLQIDWLLSQFGSDQYKVTIQYQNFVRSGVGLPPVWEGLNNPIFLEKKTLWKTCKIRLKLFRLVLKKYRGLKGVLWDSH